VKIRRIAVHKVFIWNENKFTKTKILGRMPKKGGIPPIDIRFMKIIGLIIDLDGIIFSLKSVFTLSSINGNKREIDRKKYKNKYNHQVFSLIRMIEVIQAK